MYWTETTQREKGLFWLMAVGPFQCTTVGKAWLHSWDQEYVVEAGSPGTNQQAEDKELTTGPDMLIPRDQLLPTTSHPHPMKELQSLQNNAMGLAST